LNYYKINDLLYFVDFPGYGYAKVSKTQREAWGKMIERYLLERDTLKLVMQIIDVRHPPSKDDQLMYEWLSHFDLPRIIVATKADKIPKSKWAKHLKVVKQTLQMKPQDDLILFSSDTGLGKDELWEKLAAYIEPQDEVLEIEANS
jgi:GTP-binding protein